MNHKFVRLDQSAHLPQHLAHGVVAIGNFDGVHLGHQVVLNKALEQAKKLQCPALVLTFEPHPRSFFQPNHPVDRLTGPAQKAEILSLMGFDGVIEQKFDEDFANKSASAFIEDTLVEALKARLVVTGYNFLFGKKRSGDAALLQSAGAQLGFGVIEVPPFCDESGQAISSSRIRTLLQLGDVKNASALLGYHYTVSAKVEAGAKLGRTLGYPTANMNIGAHASLAHGIYAVRFHRQDGHVHPAVASFGRRPTIADAGAELLETHLFDFDGDLYGEEASVSFIQFLRQEVKFDSLDALKIQMRKDEENARQILKDDSPISILDKKFVYDNLA